MFNGFSMWHLLILLLPILLVAAVGVLIYSVVVSRRVPTSAPVPESMQRAAQRLADVEDLFQRGVISEVERADARAKILAR